MSRRLFAVALLPSGAVAERVDGLRAALGDPRRSDLPTHVTLVPPIDLDDQGSTEALGALRRAAESVGPFELTLGPAATFAPRTATLHLAVHGELRALAALREALRQEPWDRPDDHEFVPHVTLLQRAAPDTIQAGLALLAEPLATWSVHSVHLLERLRGEEGAVWHPVAEQPLGGARVVGRGGVELALRTVSTVEPAVASLIGLDPTSPLPHGEGVLVAVADAPGTEGAPLGAAVGRVSGAGAVLDHLVVPPAQRGRGIARHVLGAFCDAALAAGAGVVATAPLAHHDASAGGPSPEQAAASLGFARLDATTWCRRVGPLGELGSPR